MTTRDEQMSLMSEIDSLQRILSNVPRSHVLERKSLERRLARLKQEAETVPLFTIPRRLKVTFRGKPVVESEGVYADFASVVTGRLADAVNAVVAGVQGDLKFMGPIPGACDSSLMITGVVKGSFGFEFQVPRKDEDSESPLFDGLNEVEVAIDKVRHLLEVAASENDDDALSEIIADIHPRAVKKVKAFLDALSDREALCAMEFNGRKFRFVDRAQLDLGRARLDDSNIREESISYDGEIQGVLPKSRTFEFKVAGTDQVLRAKIGWDIEDPDILNREFLHKPGQVRLMVTTVGQGRPRYVLNSLPELLANG